MQDSTDTKITYKAIRDRANRDAMERMPDLPTSGTVEALEAFQQEVEAIDTYDLANELSEWDWVIYYHRAMDLCLAVPGDVLTDAEDQAKDCGPSDEYGLFETAFNCAYWIVNNEIAQAIEQVKEELTDLAQTAIDNQ